MKRFKHWPILLVAGLGFVLGEAGSATAQGFWGGIVLEPQNQGGTRAATRAGAIQQQATDVVESLIEPEVKVRAYTGTRVFDAVTGELLDDGRLTMISEDEKDEYYDDGTHGDEEAGDGIYAKVEVTDDFIGQSNQRIKERLIQALYEANQLDPVDFYGYTLMSQDRREREPRSTHWKIVENKNGIGRRLVTVAAEKPLNVPNYWEVYQEKDQKLAGENGWAQTFLDEYRIEEGNLTSEFYPLYIPQPPAMPLVPPPGEQSWVPFKGIQETDNRPAPTQARQRGPERQTYYNYDAVPAPVGRVLRGRDAQ